ncbi:MAG TPA: DUF2336 domain-containing protein [Xanthobacteraceae bacterium]|nr:DUF2336 domain-containing protein [Xanthobacteraceae bacterium]
MEKSSIGSLESLSDIGLRGGVDMRPTLIRVLTDLYMQKLRHTPDEERHYTELALRLLETVDVATRAAVAARLARHLAPPLRVLQYLVNDLPEVAGPLRAHPLLQQGDAAPALAHPVHVTAVVVNAAPGLQPELQPDVPDEPAAPDDAIAPATARELNDLFIAADDYERRLIVLNLPVVAPLPAGRVNIVRVPAVGQRLEAAALSGNRDEFAQQLASALHISREQARLIARDSLGEPIAIALKALGVPRHLVYRILLFVNPMVGQSVERVHNLALLFDEMTVEAAEGMVAIWQALPAGERAAAKHQPLLSPDDAAPRARGTPAQRVSAVASSKDRREAS